MLVKSNNYTIFDVFKIIFCYEIFTYVHILKTYFIFILIIEIIKGFSTADCRWIFIINLFQTTPHQFPHISTWFSLQ